MASNIIFRLDELIRRYPPREKKQKKAPKGSAAAAYQQQLCWDCASACGGCEWSDHLKPVPGWDATPTSRVLKVGGKGKGGTRVASSFVIHYCPKFRRDTR
jgi:hypothetical protein